MSQRTEELKKSSLNARQAVCIERLRIITDSYKKTEGEPIAIRRAKALSEICARMPVNIYDNELIVGNFASKRRAAGLFPEYSTTWMEKELGEISERDAYSFGFDLAHKDEVHRLLSYWKGKTLFDHVWPLFTPQERGIMHTAAVVASYTASVSNSSAINWEKWINVGANGLIKEIDQELAKTPAEDSEKRVFLEAMTIALRATIHFAERHADMARKLAHSETDPKRKKELEKIAEICQWVPANPARTFHEALQSMTFLHKIEGNETDSVSTGFGRVDQYAYPFYKRDIDEGRLTRDEAQELIECWMIKIDESSRIVSLRMLEDVPRYSFVPVTLGGQLRNGEDATNELSFLFLDAVESAKCTSPDIAVRYHDRISDEFMLKCVDVARQGTGIPKFLNDNNGIPWLLRNRAATPEEAWNCVIMGCQEYLMMGKTSAYNLATFNITKVLEITLNDGVDPLTGKQIGLQTGKPETFATFNDLMAAFGKQIDYFKKLADTMQGKINGVQLALAPVLLHSALTENCIKEGRDRGSGAAVYNFPLGPYPPEAPNSHHYMVPGLINAVDSLASIKKNVYDNKSITMAELKDACKANFDGKGDVRQMLLRAPKYGNDDDYVDTLARDVVHMMNNSCDGLGTYNLFETIGTHVPFGRAIGATPDGRKAGEPLADAGASPMTGMDRKGPTAAVKSAMKIDPNGESFGLLFNMKFSPALLETQAGRRNLAALIKTYFGTRAGHHVQFNVVSSKTLKAAQKEPEKYQNLVVRVAGFCAYFTQISRALQDEIIKRTEQECF